MPSKMWSQKCVGIPSSHQEPTTPHAALASMSPLQQQQQQHSLFSQTSWGRLEMKSERNKFKVQAY